VHSGWTRRRALAYNVVSALPFLAGGLLAYALSGSVDVTVLVPFAAGNFIYIALADLIPQMTAQQRARDKIGHTLGFAAGLSVLYLLARVAG
jgi:zinc and cadmium transporter